MGNALIGYTGLVGGTLLRQACFDALYRSTNIHEIAGKDFEGVVCAGAAAQKWIANRQPAADREKILRLIENLKTVRCDRFTLISTVDVFRVPFGVDETTPIDEVGLHPYGLNRRLLETFVQQHFENHVIVRLPGLVGPGLRKNVIFDFLNHNNLHAIDSRGVFQFYPMVNLWNDLSRIEGAGLDLVHLTAEPISVAEIAEQGMGMPFEQKVAGAPAQYDMQTRYASHFGVTGRYQYSRRETLQAVRAYAQTEPRSGKTAAAA